MKKSLVISIIIAALLPLTGVCGTKDVTYYRKLLRSIPNSEAGMRRLAKLFVKKGENQRALTEAFIPRANDYTAFFKHREIAAYARKYYVAQWKRWNKNDPGIDPGLEKTNIKIRWTTVGEIARRRGRRWAHVSLNFSGVWNLVNEQYRVYLCVFTAPGEEYGFSIGGFTHVNGRWTIFPELKRILRIMPKEVKERHLRKKLSSLP